MKEKCFYCDNESKYDDVILNEKDFIVTGVCKLHAKNYYQG